jgi:signal transduction histidine kinase
MLGMDEQELLKSCCKDIIVEDQRNDLALKEQDENGKVAAQLSLRRKDNTLLRVEIASRNFLDTDGSMSTLISVRDIRDRLMLEEKLRTISSFTRHDIRNKLSTAFGQAYLSKKLVINQPELTKRLDQIEFSLNSIKGILDFAKEYESIGYQKLRQIDVGKTVNEAYSLFGDIKGISLVNKVCESTVLADHMLTTLFYNLIDNTVKHGEKADCIEVDIQKNKDGSETIVYKDNGIGISTKDKIKLFEATIGDGKGYGLFLIKKTCEFYGWKITEDGELGKGVRFNITIPKSNFANKETAHVNEIPKMNAKEGKHYC